MKTGTISRFCTARLPDDGLVLIAQGLLHIVKGPDRLAGRTRTLPAAEGLISPAMRPRWPPEGDLHR
jgi:hypothetical protein